jgi:hypothetical protein
MVHYCEFEEGRLEKEEWACDPERDVNMLGTRPSLSAQCKQKKGGMLGFYCSLSRLDEWALYIK